ncbi:uncharacterized protein EURHEDRAFT_167657 [Aspergillus ruber CBS 135680]|uniref:Uncharacterized protein n=1 Tax=Aspergillus ruber (strain CBS 135680) TaxID=1388766 RepID=A0A017S8Q5_ASPRC|nr:uncharacterized protein EURHEDRAFT_167657 [Aspergillus ruber CBS 135680]EYE93181.1 hypothetical protein EURHEDRAFT_167657 [Aspergillus ruber CBS 135680]
MIYGQAVRTVVRCFAFELVWFCGSAFFFFFFFFCFCVLIDTIASVRPALFLFFSFVLVFMCLCVMCYVKRQRPGRSAHVYLIYSGSFIDVPWMPYLCL